MLMCKKTVSVFNSNWRQNVERRNLFIVEFKYNSSQSHKIGKNFSQAGYHKFVLVHADTA